MSRNYVTGLTGTGICLWLMFGISACSINTDPYFFQQELDPFDTLYLNAVFNVTLEQSDHFSISISGAQDLAETVTFHIDDHILTLDNNNGLLWKHPKLEPPDITITFKTLKRVHAEETCHITCADTIRMDTFGLTLGSKLNFADLILDCGLFYYWNTSPIGGLINLSGHADIVRFYNGSLMAINASQLTAHDALVINGSKSDLHVNTDQRLYCSITGTGNVYLTGNPGDIQVGPITSTGRLIY